jgi:hypothetical protein
MVTHKYVSPRRAVTGRRNRRGGMDKKGRECHLSLDMDKANGRRGGSMVARQTVILHSRVRIWRLPSPQVNANLLVGCHLEKHLAAGWPLWEATEKKIRKNEPLVRHKHIKKKKSKSRGDWRDYEGLEPENAVYALILTHNSYVPKFK